MLKNISKLISGSLFSRILGFFREMVEASYFGTSKIADAFTLALLFPNLFRQVLGEDMVERAFMPPFKTVYDKGDKAGSWRYLSVILNFFFFALLGVTLLLYFIIPLFFALRESFPEVFSSIFGGTGSGFDYDLALKLVLIMLPFMVFIGIAAFFGSLLNFFERNWIFSFAPVMLSVGVILGIWLLEPYIGGYSIAVGYVIGAFLQMLIQLPFVFNKKFKTETEFAYHRIIQAPEFEFGTVRRESRVIALNALFNKSSEIFTRFLATSLAAGATSSLFYANRLFQLPFGVLSLSIARGINPELNRLKSQDDKEKFGQIFQKGVNLYILLFVPITVFLMISSPEIVDLAFRRGKFDERSLTLTVQAFDMYMLGLLPMSLVGYYYRVLSLFNKNKYALYVSVFNAVSNILLAWLLARYTSLGHAGIALSTTLAFFLNLQIISVYLKKELSGYLLKTNRFTKDICVLLVVFFSVYVIYRAGSLSFYDTKIISMISLSLKGLIVALIFGGWLIMNKQTAALVKPYLKKFGRKKN